MAPTTIADLRNDDQMDKNRHLSSIEYRAIVVFNPDRMLLTTLLIIGTRAHRHVPLRAIAVFYGVPIA